MSRSISPFLEFRRKIYGFRMVIFALFIRELQSRFNDKLGLGWAFLEPFLFIAALSFLRGLISGRDIHGIPIFIFMMIGLMGIRVVVSTMNTVAAAINRDRPLYALRQVHPISSFLVAGFLELVLKSGVVILLGITLFLMDIDFVPDQPVLLLAMFLAAWLLGLSVGGILAIASVFIPEIIKIRQFVSRPLFFISAVFFSLQDIPERYWPYLNWNPILHINEIARYASFEEYGLHGVSITFILLCVLTFLFFMLSVYHITWKKVLTR